ncbi:Gfo/Idh/MocA family protein [Paenibacillus harenae]|uniref:Gfo/Idh/MocA family protein n=1 Tax=Paenibacillus harenae TaxID=306543 RepID=UPI0004290031|nr:Gfo/Idh/MocA family oxidoreductase [Paenibacillus harenae]
MNKAKIIQIGTGLHGFILSTEEVELAAIVDMNADNLEKAQHLLGDKPIPAYSDYNKALQETKADIAVVVTPPGTHKKIMKDMLKAGLHVILEKPISMDWNESVEMADIADKSGKYVMISQNYRWNNVIQAVKAAVDSNVIGRIEEVEWLFARNHTATSSFVVWRKQMEEMFLKEMCVHHFDLMRYLLGANAVSIYAESSNPSWNFLDSNGAVSAIIRFEQGVMVHYYGSFINRGTETPWHGYFRLIGSEGAIESYDDTPCIVKLDGSKQLIPLADMARTGLKFSLFDMLHSVREGRKPITHIGDNLHSWEIVCRAVDSIKAERRISF